ncbi:PP-loop family protein, putative [Babesia caballi]|uniref:Cytoplasmic tRNA 2-thiolation protein 1 n=1 Tax=Babesia caballi TaxID=5871 RepID=A0AAV4LNU2_BABCB|nr:PP-loop family protein, putative [Babesia caballi]
MKCAACSISVPSLRRSLSRLPYCKQCFIQAFEEDVYETIQQNQLIVDGDVVCIGVSGGKDSSVLAHVLATLKERYNRKWKLFLLAADEGIKGYRDDSLNVVLNMRNSNYDGLKILNFKERFGFTMDEVVALIGKKNNCTVCGTFRRQILEIGARLLGANKLCTGHNIDDNAETVLLNICRNDLFKLTKNLNEVKHLSTTASEHHESKGTTQHRDGICDGDESVKESMSDRDTVREVTVDTSLMNEGVRNLRHDHVALNHSGQSELNACGCSSSNEGVGSTEATKANGEHEVTAPINRIKPMMHCFEKEIVMYARYQKLEYFSTECLYAPEAYRGYMRTFIKQLEAVDPRIIQNITCSSQHFYAQHPSNRQMNRCKTCGIEGINDLCKACQLVEKLTALTQKVKGNNNM